MNVDTGKLEVLPAEEFQQLKKRNPYVEVNPDDMTDKQKETMQVSSKDHRSKLGKQLTAERKHRKENPDGYKKEPVIPANKPASQADVEQGNVTHNLPNRKARRERDFPKSSKIAKCSKTVTKVARANKFGVSPATIKNTHGKIKAPRLQKDKKA